MPLCQQNSDNDNHTQPTLAQVIREFEKYQKQIRIQTGTYPILPSEFLRCTMFLPCRWNNHGTTMEQPWNNHGRTMEERWKNDGTNMGHRWEIYEGLMMWHVTDSTLSINNSRTKVMVKKVIRKWMTIVQFMRQTWQFLPFNIKEENTIGCEGLSP